MITSSTTYWPFGLPLETANPQEYRFGFNGMEKDPEITGQEGSHYTTHFRAYDSRIGRWWSVDPKAKKFPMQSPYVAMNNNPIYWIDPKGDDPPEKTKTYTIQEGDNLSNIAEQNNVSVDDLVEWNDNINDPNKIYAGDKINVSNSRRWTVHDQDADGDKIITDKENPEERWVKKDDEWIDLSGGFEYYGEYFDDKMNKPDGYRDESGEVTLARNAEKGE